MDKPRKDFVALLVEKGLITEDQLEEVRRLHKDRGGSLSQLLIELGYVSEKDLTIFISTYLSIPPVKLLNLKISKEVLDMIPKDVARKYLVIPLSKIGNTLSLAMADPLNILILEDLERLTGCQINPVISFRSEILEALNIYYPETVTTAIEEIIKKEEVKNLEVIKEEKEEIKDEEIKRSLEDTPVVKLTNYILKRAVEMRASDIFIEPLRNSMRVRFRIDGLLHRIDEFPKKMHNLVISRIKVMGNLDITEHRLPQEGRFIIRILDRKVDFRISILPSTLGEKAALRVLDKSNLLLDINLLGFSEKVTDHLKKDSLSSYGMILVCGPTGCGKSTTLYSILKYIYSPEKNIITVEDPIEYQLEGVNQVNVNYEVGLTFASALRSILRQDPDVIMVGEIRDFDTVDIAIKAALTGHLVLSTLHTTTSTGALVRLINMGVEPFLLSSTLIGVLAQRLVRRLCLECREKVQMEEEIREKYKIKKEAAVYKPRGCRACLFQGYKGRVAIGEYLHLDTKIKELINRSAPEPVIREEAKSGGLTTLREDGIKKIEAGLTSLEEVIKVTSEE
ncbi:MAG: hypothetical protein B6D56_02610 [Candidatus Omnitrophica bacterium 4484_70.1]|nr:MAG: hypothetical protein B6D56_02610 [Candidatus Omnitrophica bacterium 4484_70.1]